jgi:hypothetical protein
MAYAREPGRDPRLTKFQFPGSPAEVLVGQLSGKPTTRAALFAFNVSERIRHTALVDDPPEIVGPESFTRTYAVVPGT